MSASVFKTKKVYCTPEDLTKTFNHSHLEHPFSYLCKLNELINH